MVAYPTEGGGMTTEQNFERQLDANPHDWELRVVYADWLEERDEAVRANGQRWQGVNQKSPSREFGAGLFWDWFTGHLQATSASVGSLCSYDVYRRHGTRQDAELALALELDRQNIVAGVEVAS